MLTDSELYRFIPQDPPSTPDALEERYRTLNAGPPSARARWWNWAVRLRDESHFLAGTVQVTVPISGPALLAYTLGQAFWHRGYATEACAAVLAWLRDATAVRGIDAYIDTRNARSVALVQRLGFTRLETIKNADHFKGSSSDEFHYGLELY